MAQQPQRCECGKLSNETGHHILICFLEYDNDEFEQEKWGRDFFCFPINKMATWWTESDYIHCQISLANWEKSRNKKITVYDSYSVDAHRNVCVEEKQFTRKGWHFSRIFVSYEQEQAIRYFLNCQLGKPFNGIGIKLFWIFPWSGNGEKWFCSELTMAALQYAGLFQGYKPEECYPGLLKDIFDSSGRASHNAHPVLQANTPIVL